MIDRKKRRYGWASNLPHFQKTGDALICDALRAALVDSSDAQVVAWKNMVPILNAEFGEVLAISSEASEYSAILEYTLPRDERRPDVIVLENGVVVVLEFKDKHRVLQADIDQAGAYGRDLKNYHSLCHDAEVESVLIPTRWRGGTRRLRDVTICEPGALDGLLVDFAKRGQGGSPFDPHLWIDADYAPLPGIVQAARDIFEHEPLPFIKRAQSARLPEVHELLVGIAHEAARTKTRRLILLTGVPGSGKTLAGLQFVHSPGLEDLRTQRPGQKVGAPAVFLSGNGPLVDVLQHALKTRAFVQGMKKFIDEYAFRKPDLVPFEHVLVFDEAQRAWDAELVEAKHGHAASEPELLLSIANRIPDWAVVLGLVGEGQEIHRGEEGGLGQWNEALEGLENASEWFVHGPPSLQTTFSAAQGRFHSGQLLNLSTTLRTHLAADLHCWVRLVLDGGHGSVVEAANIAKTMLDQGYAMYLTRSIEQAKDYVRTRYEGQPQHRYGLLASSRAKNLEAFGIDNSWMRTRRFRAGPWYNDPVDRASSCCSLEDVATEFSSQGLELDFPIVCWGDDLVWKTDRFESRPTRSRGLRDAHQLRINAYRVLLTRGRDGMCVYIPPDAGDGMDATADLLGRAGIEQLQLERAELRTESLAD
jgi:DUF2075 family protein